MCYRELSLVPLNVIVIVPTTVILIKNLTHNKLYDNESLSVLIKKTK